MVDARGIAIGPESVARTLSAAVIGDDVYRRSASLLLGESDEVSAVALFPYATPHMLAVHKLMFGRSEEHTSELQSLMRISYAVFCLKKKQQTHQQYSFILSF